MLVRSVALDGDNRIQQEQVRQRNHSQSQNIPASVRLHPVRSQRGVRDRQPDLHGGLTRVQPRLAITALHPHLQRLPHRRAPRHRVRPLAEHLQPLLLHPQISHPVHRVVHLLRAVRTRKRQDNIDPVLRDSGSGVAVTAAGPLHEEAGRIGGHVRDPDLLCDDGVDEHVPVQSLQGNSAAEDEYGVQLKNVRERSHEHDSTVEGSVKQRLAVFCEVSVHETVLAGLGVSGQQHQHLPVFGTGADIVPPGFGGCDRNIATSAQIEVGAGVHHRRNRNGDSAHQKQNIEFQHHQGSVPADIDVHWIVQLDQLCVLLSFVLHIQPKQKSANHQLHLPRPRH